MKSITISPIVLLLFLKVSLNAQINFSEVSFQSGIDHAYLGFNEMGGGAAFFDKDGDGDEDLWITGGKGRDVLYENNGAGFFTEVGAEAFPEFEKVLQLCLEPNPQKRIDNLGEVINMLEKL